MTDYNNTNVLLYVVDDLKTTQILLKYIPKDNIYIDNAFYNVINFKRSYPNVFIENDYYNFIYNYIEKVNL